MRKRRAVIAAVLIALAFGLWAHWALMPDVREMAAATFVREAEKFEWET